MKIFECFQSQMLSKTFTSNIVSVVSIKEEIWRAPKKFCNVDQGFDAF